MNNLTKKEQSKAEQLVYYFA